LICALDWANLSFRLVSWSESVVDDMGIPKSNNKFLMSLAR
jgi:hypothetical protein